jgi:hypothetical protein
MRYAMTSPSHMSLNDYEILPRHGLAVLDSPLSILAVLVIMMRFSRTCSGMGMDKTCAVGRSFNGWRCLFENIQTELTMFDWRKDGFKFFFGGEKKRFLR